MNSSNFRFTLDLHSIQSQFSIPVMVGDTSVALHMTITDGGVPYMIEDGCLAKISIKRPTGTHLEEFCKIKNNSIVVYEFSQNENTCAVEGIHHCDVVVYGLDGGIVGSPRFTMVVSNRVINSDDITVTDEDYTAVNAMLKAEAQRQYDETQRVDAETERISAEEKRISAEAVRVSNEEIRVESENERTYIVDILKSTIKTINNNSTLRVDANGNATLFFIGMIQEDDGEGNVTISIAKPNICGTLNLVDDGNGNINTEVI